MHNLISQNQLASWNHFASTVDYSTEQHQLINDYFDCLIECDDTQQYCKRICKRVLKE
ncbi:hypothetical protein Syn7803C72_3 [Synechococcus phage ACG-2014d]|uniref:Uncharacterized protein n=1 Tax=Synechococcus phage ACG-2014d TaxID=1493509 RepID=A0A0E3ENJ1_9CAUD|nr:hypothetical protein AAJ59_gp003 [Synechococcus phage ACG-2014d]YP_010355172.1 hypothetical protein M1M12_gp003 [Synechococcus phage ACG-2014d]AIX14614.1 hypothetical protein Syn7803C45_3 [Synechococcus phage ACG-2014d]AIX14834.1 hypothetical protein Syn7803C46_3 [Synechococcus phage ACG-2014d]AIX15261.1 hypothetical protein Syn7803C48_3 [Synechococcus phage ACG-2014d]AIX15479.1 hypothetical protein Syn7803C49_3 [Synechococcus phage ACG-2014d]AIX15908.1 hypothetical protein Syn7803C54_3 [S